MMVWAFPSHFQLFIVDLYRDYIGEIEEILPQKNILFLPSMCIYVYIAMSTNKTSL